MAAISARSDLDIITRNGGMLDIYGACVMYFIRHAIVVPNQKKYVEAELGWNYMKHHREEPRVKHIIDISLKPYNIQPDTLWSAFKFAEDWCVHTENWRTIKARPPIKVGDVPWGYKDNLSVVINAARVIWDSKTPDQRKQDLE